MPYTDIISETLKGKLNGAQIKRFTRVIQDHQELSDIFGDQRMSSDEIKILALNWIHFSEADRRQAANTLNELLNRERQLNISIGHC